MFVSVRGSGFTTIDKIGEALRGQLRWRFAIGIVIDTEQSRLK